MKQVPSQDFQRNFGQVTDDAVREGVTVTRHGRPWLAVVAADEWERLREAAGKTTALATEEISEADMAAMRDQAPPPGNNFADEDYSS